VSPGRPLARELALPGLLVLLVLGLTLGLVLGAPGCSGPDGEITPEERAAVATEVEAEIQDFWDDWRRADFRRAMTWYDDHPDFSFASVAETWSSVQAVDEAFRGVWDDIERAEYQLEAPRLAVLTRDLVHVVERGVYISHHRDGTAADPMEFAFSCVWVRTPDGWKIRFGHIGS
jgi:ketosteroid isomerase-like protein